MSEGSKSEKKEPKTKGAKPTEGQTPECTCIQDPFAALPPELRPRKRSWMSGLRKVTCPGCGAQFWTNRKTDLCADCEKKSVQASAVETETESGG